MHFHSVIIQQQTAFLLEVIVNKYFFGGKIEKETTKGWGFPRYIVKKLGPMAGTLMAVDPNAPKVTKFITLSSKPYIIQYNSRLPIVVYVPDGAEVRYRIWTAGEDIKTMEAG
jgi:ecotin